MVLAGTGSCCNNFTCSGKLRISIGDTGGLSSDEDCIFIVHILRPTEAEEIQRPQTPLQSVSKVTEKEQGGQSNFKALAIAQAWGVNNLHHGDTKVCKGVTCVQSS